MAFIVIDSMQDQYIKVNAPNRMNNIAVAFFMVFLGSLSATLLPMNTLSPMTKASPVTVARKTMMAQLFIINMVYSSWMEVRSSHLMLSGIAFTSFFIAEVAHTYNMIWGPSTFEFFIRHVLRITALALLAYILIHYKISRTPKVSNSLHDVTLSGS